MFSRDLLRLGGASRMSRIFPHLLLLHMVSDGFHLGGDAGFMPWFYFVGRASWERPRSRGQADFSPCHMSRILPVKDDLGESGSLGSTPLRYECTALRVCASSLSSHF